VTKIAIIITDCGGVSDGFYVMHVGLILLAAGLCYFLCCIEDHPKGKKPD